MKNVHPSLHLMLTFTVINYEKVNHFKPSQYKNCKLLYALFI